jgi:hypothetical protein
VNATRSATEEDVPAVVKIQRDQVVLPLVLVVRRDVQVLPQAQAATQRCGAFGRVEERDFRDFILRKHRDDDDGYPTSSCLESFVFQRGYSLHLARPV